MVRRPCCVQGLSWEVEYDGPGDGKVRRLTLLKECKVDSSNFKCVHLFGHHLLGLLGEVLSSGEL